MANPDEQNNQPPAQPAPPVAPPSVDALAKENATLRRELEARSKAYEEAEAKATRMEGLYTGVKTKARRQRVVSRIAGDFSSPAAVSALADQAWSDLEAIERPDGASDEDYELAMSAALHERLSSIEDGALLRAPATTTGGGRMAGPVIARPSAPYNPYDTKPK